MEHEPEDGCLDEIVRISEEEGLYEEEMTLSEYMDTLAPEDGIPSESWRDAQVVEHDEEECTCWLSASGCKAYEAHARQEAQRREQHGEDAP